MENNKPFSVKDSVQVAVNIRPLITSELLQGCRDCITVIPGEPQIQLGSHCFTFDYVYTSPVVTSSKRIFDECVAPLVDGLFHGYNATVLAYGQTGSGKTYTMGTGYTPGGNNGGVIPQVMERIFDRVSSLSDKAQFRIRVSFLEILKEEIHDLLAEAPAKVDPNGIKTPTLTRPCIQIRESNAGDITLSGITEADVSSLQEMALCLAQGSLARATGSTSMNTYSSRSHAIFTITLERKRKAGKNSSFDAVSEDFLCAKLHLVDLAGSERAKRTKTDGARFKEGVHINKGLLALGNVISVLGEDKKRKESRHVPYRDSKLTRLLQDSLGGNSRTVMIACISPADSNVEETLNTLKYANRARNIQNKPIVNRDPLGTEMQKLRQQLSLLQAELVYARTNECSPTVLESLKQKLASLEGNNESLRKELQESQQSCSDLCQRVLDAQVEKEKFSHESHFRSSEVDESYMSKINNLESELQELRLQSVAHTRSQSLDIPDLSDSISQHEMEVDAMTSKEVEHHMFLRESMDKELHELNRQLKEKEAERRNVVQNETAALKDQFDKRIQELEEEKQSLQEEKSKLSTELESLLVSSDEQAKRVQDSHVQKLKDLEDQIADLKIQQEHAQHRKDKEQPDESADRLETEIHRIKQQKVHLQNRIKHEFEHFRTWKARREKELLRLRKEGRKNEYEMHKLQTLHERQKQVLQRKTEEAAAVSRRLKEVLEARKQAARENNLSSGPPAKLSTKTFQLWFDQELENAVRLREARISYEKQSALQENLTKEEEDVEEPRLEPTSPCDTETPSTLSCFFRGDLFERSSTAITTSRSLDDEQSIKGPLRWQQVRTLGDAKDLLNFVFNVAASARCQLRDRECENKNLKLRLDILIDELRHTKSICQKQELEQSMALIEVGKADSDSQPEELLQLELDDLHMSYENVSGDFNSEELHESCETASSPAKSWRWRKYQPLQFKWKWQRPWRISQWTSQHERAIRRRPNAALRVLDMI